MKKLCLIAFFLSSLQLLANEEQKKDSSWKLGGDYSLLFSQVSLSNWASGGESSLATNAFLNLYANYKKGRQIWDTKLEMAYGLQKQGEEGVRKIDDKLNFSTTYGQRAFKNWYYTFNLSLKTQFANGYKYPDTEKIISQFFAPAYIILSLGFEYKPSNKFLLNVSPVSGKITVVAMDELSDEGAFGIEPGKHSKAEFVGSLKVNLKQKIMKNVELKSNFELLSNYKDEPENFDIDWEVFLKMKVNSLITATITTHLIYDDDINITDQYGNTGPRTQFKEIFGIGISSKF